MRYLDPKNDLTFKKVFGKHPHLLRSLLNALLPLQPDEEIINIEYLPAELVPDIPLLKNSIVDVRCTDTKNRQFIVEMQMLWTDSFKSRVLFNASKAYIQQLDKGREYKGLQPVYALSFVNEIFEPELPTFYHHYSIVHSQYPEKQLEGLEFVFVELPKFAAKSLNEKKMQVLWLQYLTEIKDQTEEIPRALLENHETREAVECLEESAFSREELQAYDKYWDSISSERTLLDAAETTGLERGLKEGEAIGLEKGEAIGLEKGKREKALEMARNLKQLGLLTIQQIATLTGLSEKEVEGL